MIEFNYLRLRYVLILFVAVVLSSVLFSVTAFVLFGFYRNFNSYLGEERRVLAIYDRKSSTPFTSLVPMYLAEK